MNVPDRIVQLVETFDNNLDSYKKGAYNETQVRLEFINPLFEELGWDVNNRQGYAEAYKDVIHEDAIKVGGVTKAPDYCFRIGGTRKFFLEAKKPSVNIKDDLHPAFQLRRYAWSAKLPLSVLTDFEEFAVYDCRVRPAKTDKVSHSRIAYFNYTDYVGKWMEISTVFSKEAVLKGSFDRYVDTNKVKKGTTGVDTAFLQEIERWRDLLARNIALRNPALSQRELNFAVQQTIDRIIFLRICEDRGIEEYGRLMALKNGANTYPRLFELFKKADAKYNSGLFHFKAEKNRQPADTLSPDLTVDDKPLKEIFKNLYYPDSPYEFSVLPADILGQVYEKFLGKVIYLTPSHQAKIEEKPEVRKAGGVYYTPTYIVDYIVKNTVGKLVDGKKPGPRGAVSKLKILDPACGSGSFLMGAYQFLLDWHLDEYIKDGPEKWDKGKTPRLYRTDKGEWRLTTDERKRILINNIFGVDIDPQAVEVTKLSLLLKVLEGEDEQSIGKQMFLFQERVLPDLENNIKCGNSLIGPDYYDISGCAVVSRAWPAPTTANEENDRPDKALPPVGAGHDRDTIDDEIFRINAFDWKSEFSEIMADGGFDAVIGNPPYVRQEGLGEIKPYLKRYAVFHGTADLYVYFMERGISLLNDHGRFGYIIANKWMRANYAKPLRNWLKDNPVSRIIDFGDLPVFKDATTYPCILLVDKTASRSFLYAANLSHLDFTDLSAHVENNQFKVNKAALGESGWSLIDEASWHLMEKMRKAGKPLGEYVNRKIYYGIKTGLNAAFVISPEIRDQLIAEDPKSAELIKPFALGKDVKRYQPLPQNQYIIMIPKGWTRIRVDNPGAAWNWLKNSYSAIAEHLAPYAEKAKKRCDQGEYWWELRACDYYDEFEKPKILYAEISIKGQFTIDCQNFYCDTTGYILGANSYYLLGLLNSKLCNFFFSNISSSIRGGFFRWKRQYVELIPVYSFEKNSGQDISIKDRIAEMAKRLQELHGQMQSSKLPQEKKIFNNQIKVLDHQIDNLVYQLYGLTDEEIKIVDQAT